MRPSDGRLVDVMALLPVGVFLCDAEGVITQYNRRAAEIWGREPRVGDPRERFCGAVKVYGRDGTAMLHDDTPIARVLRTGVAEANQELILERPDGSRRTVLVNPIPMTGATGAVVGALNCMLDITDRRRTEAALRQSEARLAHVLRSVSVVLYTAQPATPYGGIWVSENVEALSGFPARRFVEDPDFWAERLHPEERARVLEQFAALEDRSMVVTEYRWRCADGEYRWFLDQAVMHRAPYGDPVEIVGTWQDITQHKRMVETLRDSEERFRLLVEGVQDYAIVMLDPNGRIMSWNTGAERITGYRAEEVLGRDHACFCTSEDVEAGKPLHALRTAAEAGRWEEEGWRLRKDGDRFLAHVLLTAVRDETGRLRGFAKITRDMTERAETQRQLESSFRQLRALSRRLEATREDERRRIAREVHDGLGAALTCLKLDLVRLGAGLEGESAGGGNRPPAERIRDMVALVEQTVAMVRRIATELRPAVLDDFGLVAAIEWQVKDFQARTGITAVLESGTEDLEVDRERATALFRICQEALINVVRHARARRIVVRLEERARELRLDVEDDGVGIPAERIRDPHSLGLLGMRERVVPFGGEVRVERRPGGGTAVRVCLLREARPAQERQPTREGAGAPIAE